MGENNVKKAIDLTIAIGSWREARTILKNRGIELSAEQLLEVISAFHLNSAQKLTDTELVSELVYWADGGSFSNHLSGFFAIPPETLVQEAKNRMWTVINATSGATIVNPPEHKPILIPVLSQI